MPFFPMEKATTLIKVRKKKMAGNCPLFWGEDEPHLSFPMEQEITLLQV